MVKKEKSIFMYIDVCGMHIILTIIGLDRHAGYLKSFLQAFCLHSCFSHQNKQTHTTKEHQEVVCTLMGKTTPSRKGILKSQVLPWCYWFTTSIPFCVPRKYRHLLEISELLSGPNLVSSYLQPSQTDSPNTHT